MAVLTRTVTVSSKKALIEVEQVINELETTLAETATEVELPTNVQTALALRSCKLEMTAFPLLMKVKNPSEIICVRLKPETEIIVEGLHCAVVGEMVVSTEKGKSRMVAMLVLVRVVPLEMLLPPAIVDNVREKDCEVLKEEEGSAGALQVAADEDTMVARVETGLERSRAKTQYTELDNSASKFRLDPDMVSREEPEAAAICGKTERTDGNEPK